MQTLASPTNVEVGRFYQVPCIFAYDFNGVHGTFWTPVIGPLHEDAQYIGFTPTHWHIDYRFIPEEIFLALNRPVSDSPRALATVVVQDRTRGEIVLKRRKCRRLMPDFPWERAGYMPALEAAYSEHRINPEAPVCPHRGMPLVGVPDAEGNVICSGHGLGWNLRTGKLVYLADK